MLRKQAGVLLDDLLNAADLTGCVVQQDDFHSVAWMLLGSARMRYIVALLLAAGLYTLFSRHAATPPAPARPVTSSASSAAPVPQATASNVLKRPLDRTHSVLDQVREQRDGNAF